MTTFQSIPGSGEQRDQQSEFSGTSVVYDGEILARGMPIGDLVGNLSFIEMIFFQLQARRPTPNEARMTEAYLVSLCEHGVTSPSTHGARVAASVRAPFASAAIGFISAAMGSYHFGALELAMEELLEVEESAETPEHFLDRRASCGRRVWGYGHRFHKSTNEPDPQRSVAENADPRVRRLIELAEELDWSGQHLATVRQIGKLLCERKGIPINIDGIAAAILLDMGFAPNSAMMFVILGRLPNIARLYEEEQRYSPNRFTGLGTNTDPGFDRMIDRDVEGGNPS